MLTRRTCSMVSVEVSDAHGGLPCVESFQSVIAGGVCRAAAGRDREAISDGGLTDNEPLQPAWRAKSLHAALSLSKRQMAVLRAIIQPLLREMFKPRCDLAFGCAVGSQLVSDDASWQAISLYRSL